MKKTPFTVKVPATSANLGPGFDCLGLALNLWNEASFSFQGNSLVITAEGYTRNDMPSGTDNLIYTSFCEFCTKRGTEIPGGIEIKCTNRIPIGSGLGSSSTAVLIGIMAANEYLETNLSKEQLLQEAAAIEGHPDNVGPAIYGGLTGAGMDEKSHVRLINFPVAAWNIALTVPHYNLLTSESRKLLPQEIPLKNAVFNIGHSVLVLKALETGDEELLGFAMKDKLHQPYRLPVIPGAAETIQAALDAGAAAAALSGAGPGLIAFSMSNPNLILEKMKLCLQKNHMACESFISSVTNEGAYIIH